MDLRELSTLNALVTFAAENIPGGLSSDEQEVARIVGRWNLDGVPVRPVCPHCRDVAPYAEGFGVIPAWWLQFHMDNPFHRWRWLARNVITRGKR